MTKAELQKDVDFLVNRSMKAGSCSLTGYRETGMSSNSIVAIAYGIIELKDQCLPADCSDMQACRNMWQKLPDHRKTKKAIQAFNTAKNSNYYGK